MSKKIKSILTALLVVTTVLIISCKGSTTETNIEVIDESKGKEYTAAYVCPMHCKGSGSDKEGKCPVCSMTYVPNDDSEHVDHQHE